MKLFFVLLFISNFCFSQRTIRGNYLTVNQFTVSHIHLKKGNKVKWYTKGCTNKGTTEKGNWEQLGDTIIVKMENDTSRFLLVNNHLCSIDDNNSITEETYGMPKVRIANKLSIAIKARRVRRRS